MTSDDQERLRGIVEHVAHLLPAQGPISVFIHHNVLHSFEGLPFEEAVARAARIYGAQAFWPAALYRASFDEGRITHDDLREVIDADLGERGAETIAGLATRREVAFVATRYGIPDVRGPALDWHLHEEGALERFREPLPPSARAAIAATGAVEARDVTRVLRRLWDACVAAVTRAPGAEPIEERGDARRHRQAVRRASGIDIDDEVHAFLVRFVSAYLDQGLALWTMPDREDGLYAAFVSAYRHRWLAPLVGSWGRELVALLEAEAAEHRDAFASLAASLDALGVAVDEQEAFVLDTALALKGWAGMVHQLELRPDRVPVWPVPARLADFLAVRLLVERAVVARVTRGRGLAVAPGDAPVTSRAPTAEERAFALFHLAQLLGLDPMRIERLSADDVTAIERVLLSQRANDEQRWLHCAYELHLRRRFLDAMAAHRPEPDAGHPFAQAIFCVDEREESIRRHLEEFDDRIETLSTAGFFGVAMYHQGVRDARPRPLAPVAITPKHFVPMELGRDVGVARGFAREMDRLRAQTLHVGSRSLVRGAIVSIAGAISLVPLVLRVLFPRRLSDAVMRPRTHGKLRIDRVERVAPPVGERIGYSLEEMTAIVARVLEELGLATGRFARLVVVVGHSSDSLNNPHRSAYDCGACGGGPGGANARAFATMANRKAVRAKLAEGGLVVPDTTWFVAAEHNTTDDSVTWFDEDEIPPTHAQDVARAHASFDEARKRNAEERCRRFVRTGAAAPEGEEALDAVAKRRWDLAEPRPEYNHATNAFCVVGRRKRTRGLFLDRRAFLVSYDPTRDPDGAVLERILGAVVPVVVGINLEYLFGAIDNEVYGAGSKLPHNVASLIGVMNGAGGDLRTGLWSQTVEIHEPVRVTFVIETSPDRLAAVVAKSEMLTRLVRHRWLFLATQSPQGFDIHDLATGEPKPHVGERTLPVVRGRSADWFRGKRGHLDFVKIEVEDMR